jgi:hypothetical protein
MRMAEMEDMTMDRNEVAAILGRRRACKSIDRAMSIISQGYDLVAVWKGGDIKDWEGFKLEHPDAHFVLLAKGFSQMGNRVGAFYPTGFLPPRLF